MIDANGNEICPGQLVHVKVGSEWLQGRVTETQPGGTIMKMIKNVPVVTPSLVVVSCEVKSQVRPDLPLHQDIVVLLDPPKKVPQGVD